MKLEDITATFCFALRAKSGDLSKSWTPTKRCEEAATACAESKHGGVVAEKILPVGVPRRRVWVYLEVGSGETVDLDGYTIWDKDLPG